VSKYTNKQLKEMAQDVMACLDSRKDMLVLAIQLRTGLSQHEIITRIDAYAKSP